MGDPRQRDMLFVLQEYYDFALLVYDSEHARFTRWAGGSLALAGRLA